MRLRYALGTDPPWPEIEDGRQHQEFDLALLGEVRVWLLDGADTWKFLT